MRTRVSEIREMGRATQGVTLIGLDEGSQLSGVQRIVENDATLDEGELDTNTDHNDNTGNIGNSADSDAENQAPGDDTTPESNS